MGIAPLGGPTTATDPANPGFCVGPPVACGTGSGVSGSFAFADVTPILSTITFTFFGSTSGAATGHVCHRPRQLRHDRRIHDRQRDLFVGEPVLGDFTSVIWDGTNALFTGTPSKRISTRRRSTVVFNVEMVAGYVPEPATLTLAGMALAGYAIAAHRRRRRSQ